MLSSCTTGGHRLWWEVEAPDAGAALSLLPRYLAARTDVIEVARVMVP